MLKIEIFNKNKNVMIRTVDIEKYFIKNFKISNLKDCIGLVAWKTGNLVNCQGKDLAFEKNLDEIIRKGEYDYTVKRLKVKKTLKELVLNKIIKR